jgi:hypothetical protein
MQEGDDSQKNVEDNIERMVKIISGMVRKTKGIRISNMISRFTDSDDN